MDDYIKKTFNREIAVNSFNYINEEKQIPKDDQEIILYQKKLSTAD